MPTTRSVVSIFSIAMMALGAGSVTGQEYPTKTIRISTVPPGGGTDGLARLIAGGITGPLGQPVIVENRPTNLAIDLVVKAPPDGYTMLITGAALWVQTLMQLKPAWDPINDFSPITIAVNMPNIMIVHPSLPVKSVKDLINLAKSRPGELNYSQGTPGGASHLAGELFNSLAGTKIVGIPYRASTGGITALLGGETQVGFENLPSTSGLIKAGKLKILAVSARQPSVLLPGVPTVEQSGLPGYYLGSHQGVWAPAKTPAAIVRRLNQEIVRAITSPEIKQKILESGAEPNGNSPEEMAAYIKTDLVRLAKVVKDAGIKPQ